MPRIFINNKHAMSSVCDGIIYFDYLVLHVCWLNFFLPVIPDGAPSVATGYLFIPVTAVQTLHSVSFIEADAHL